MQEPMADDQLAPLLPEMRRVARLVTGSRDGAEAAIRAIMPRIDALRGSASEDLGPEAWRVFCQSVEHARVLDVSELPPLAADATSSDRVARALAALPARKRLAIGMRHQTSLSTDRMAEAMDLDTAGFTALVAAAEAHLQALVRALGDTLHLTGDEA